MKQVFTLFLAFTVFLPVTEAQSPLKVVNGRVKEIWLERQELVLSYKHPVTHQQESLVLKVGEGTGFSEGVRFENLRKGEPLSVDYEEDPSGTARAVQIKRVPIRGIPKEIFR